MKLAAAILIASLFIWAAQAAGPTAPEAASIQLARQYILEELDGIETAHKYTSRAFRRAQVAVLADLLITGNVYRGEGIASTTHPAAARFLKQQGTILKRLTRYPESVLDILQTSPVWKRRLRFEKALQLYLQELRSDAKTVFRPGKK